MQLDEMTTQPPRAQVNRWWLVIAAGLSLAMVQLDAMTVSVAIPAIQEALHTTPGIVGWVMLGFTLPAIALVFPAGRWLDRIGRRPALLVSVTGFVGVGALGALSPDIGWLIASRVVQGGFGAVLFVLMPLLVTGAVTAQARGRAMGIMFTIGPLGGIGGPFLGGILIDNFGWQAIFLLNVPIAVVVLAIGLTQLPATDPLVRPDRGMIVESGLLIAATAVVMVALTLATEVNLAWLGLTVVAVPIVAAWWRLPSGQAVRGLFKVPGVRAPLIALWAQTTGQIVLVFLVPFYLARFQGVSPSVIGLVILVLSVGMVVFSPIAGWASDHWGSRQTATTGMIVLTGGFAALAWLDESWTLFDLVWRMALVGIGIGVFAGAQTAMAMSAAPAELAGSTSAAISLARQIGIGTAPALATILWGLSGYELSGMRTAIAVTAVFAAIGAMVLLRAGKTP